MAAPNTASGDRATRSSGSLRHTSKAARTFLPHAEARRRGPQRSITHDPPFGSLGHDYLVPEIDARLAHADFTDHVGSSHRSSSRPVLDCSRRVGHDDHHDKPIDAHVERTVSSYDLFDDAQELTSREQTEDTTGKSQSRRRGNTHAPPRAFQAARGERCRPSIAGDVAPGRAPRLLDGGVMQGCS